MNYLKLRCKNCAVLYLEDAYQSEEGKKYFAGVMAVTNMIAMFVSLAESGIKEVVVNREEMGAIVQFILGNAPNSKECFKLVREGKTDKFMGVRLLLKVERENG